MEPASRAAHFRFLVVSPPTSGHFTPLLSIASELKARGHDVTFLGLVHKGREDFFLKEVNRAGIPFHSLGYCPQSKTDDQSSAVKAESSRSSPFLTYMEGDVATWIGLDKFLANQTATAGTGSGSGQNVTANVMVLNHAFQVTGSCAENKYGILPVYVHTWRNFVISPSWPFLAMGTNVSIGMSFWQRLWNEYVRLRDALYVEPFVLRRKLESILREKRVKLPVMPRGYLQYDGSAAIIIGGPGFDFPVPLPPTAINTGPLLSRFTQEISRPLAAWLAERKPGSVVVVDLGTDNPLTHDMVVVIIGGLQDLTMEVLWVVTETAYSALTPFEVPVNFWLEKSIPQREVLRHPSVAAMITHCGGDGAQEALAYGVPVIGLPMTHEEFDVAQKLAHAGFPVLDPLRAMPADLSAAVRAVTTRDPATENVYRAKARKIARIFQFQGAAPRAADFVELVAELGTDHQLRTPDLSMPSFVKYKLDLLILVAIFAGVIFLAANVSVRFLVGELL